MIKILDLFCGGGGCSVGYKQAFGDDAFIVGVDINRSENYPYHMVQADAIEFLCSHGHEFDFIHASPPCQGHSVTKNMSGREDDGLLALTRVLLRFLGKPFVIENTPGADMRSNHIRLRGDMFGLKTLRMRYFESNMLLLAPPMPRKKGKTSGNGKGYSTLDDAEYVTVAGNNFRYSDGCIAMDIFWMNRDELKQAIPPAYTHYLGKQIARYVA